MKNLIVLLVLLISFYNYSFANEVCENISKNYTFEDKLDGKSFVSSIDGKSYAFIGKELNNFFVVKDGIKGKNYDDIWDLTYSKNGNSFSYIAIKNGKWFVVKDNVELINFSKITDLAYTPNGKDIIYLGYENLNTNNVNGHIVINSNIIGGKYNQSYNITFSPNGEDYFYKADKGGKSFYVSKNGKEGIKYDNLGMEGNKIIYSNDGKHTAYWGFRDGKFYIVRDGIESKESYDNMSSFNFINDGKDLIYIGWKGAIPYLYINGEKQKYAGVSNLVFSPNLKEYAFTYVGETTFSKAESFTIVKNGNEIGKYYYVSQLTYSPNGESFAFLGSDSKGGDKFIVKDGVKTKSYNWIYEFKYSNSGKKIAFIAEDKVNNKSGFSKEGKQYIVLDGVEGKKYDRIARRDSLYELYYFHFSPINEEIVYVGNIGDKYYAIIGDKESADYKKVGSSSASRINFTNDGKNYYYSIGYGDYVENGIEKNKKDGYSIDKLGYLENGQKFYFLRDNNNNKFINLCSFDNNKVVNKTITNNYNLSEKDLKLVLNASNTIKKFSISKQNQYKKALSNLLLKQKEGTRNFALIKAILENIK